MNDDEYDEKSSQVRQLAQMPADQLTDKLAAVHQTTSEIAPTVAPHIHAVTMNAIKYLNSKLPFAGNELAMDPEHGPSKAQRSQWLKLHEAVNDPLSILDHVKNGTLSPHHVEAVKAVYPDLHQEMVDKVNEEIGSMKSKGQRIPYKTSLHLAQLTGAPLDSTMTPQSMQSVMQSALPQQMAQQAGKGKSSKASGPELTQINKTNAIYATQEQARQLVERK